MKLFICLAVGISVVASLDVNDCKGKATFTFNQGCHECWCRNGRAACSNARTNHRRGVICNWTDDNEEEVVADTPGLTSNAAGVKPWDLDFPSITMKEVLPAYPFGRQPTQPVPPYPTYPTQMIYQQNPPIPNGNYNWPQFWGRVNRKGTNIARGLVRRMRLWKRAAAKIKRRLAKKEGKKA